MDDCKSEMENITWTVGLKRTNAVTEHQIDMGWFFWRRRLSLGGKTAIAQRQISAVNDK